MKTAVSFIFSFILLCVVGTFFAALLFMVGIDLKYLVAGEPLHLFSSEFFIRGIFYTFPAVCVVSQLLLILYIVRHPAKPLIPSIMFTIIAFVSWIILIPCDMQLADIYAKEAHVEEKYVPLSTEYFREEVGGVYYYTRILDDDKADGVFLDVNGVSTRKSGVVKFNNVLTANASAYPYADVLVKEAVKPSVFVEFPMKVYSSLMDVAMRSWKAGFVVWFSFASLGLALFSLYGLQFCSSWRFLNSFLIMLCGNFVVYLNYLIYSGKFFPEFISTITDKFSFISSENSIVVVLNLFIFLIFFIYGLIMGIYRYRKNSANEAEDF